LVSGGIFLFGIKPLTFQETYSLQLTKYAFPEAY